MTEGKAVLLTLIAYGITLLVIGVICQRRTRDGIDFFLGGRRLGPLVASISAAASSSSAWTLLGVSGFAYLYGLSAIWLFPACVGGFLLNWFVLAGPLRRVSKESGAITLTEMLAGSPGRPLGGRSIPRHESRRINDRRAFDGQFSLQPCDRPSAGRTQRGRVDVSGYHPEAGLSPRRRPTQLKPGPLHFPPRSGVLNLLRISVGR